MKKLTLKDKWLLQLGIDYLSGNVMCCDVVDDFEFEDSFKKCMFSDIDGLFSDLNGKLQDMWGGFDDDDRIEELWGSSKKEKIAELKAELKELEG